MAFLKNCWYLAAWSEEVADRSPFARTLVDKPIVFYRFGEKVVALFDRCPHRFAPLSLVRSKTGISVAHITESRLVQMDGV
jgi:vanillate O-demethylase monooxygenase subunit